MKLLTALLLLPLMLNLNGCAALRWLQAPPSLPLMPPQALGQQLQATQVLTTEQQGKTLSMLASWVVNQQGMTLVGLTATGQELMRIHYDGFTLNHHYSPMLENAPPAQQILAQIQLAYWPIDAIQQQLQGSNWRLTELGAKRVLYYYTSPVFEAERTGEQQLAPDVRIYIPELNTQLSVSTVASQILDD